MKLVTFAGGSTISCGILTDRGIIDVPAAWPGGNPPHSIIEILQRGDPCLEKLARIAASADAAITLESVTLLAPIPTPGKVLALAGNYSEHIAEVGLTLGLSRSTRNTTVPRPFLKPATAVAAHNAQIPWPAYSEQIDYEIELAVVIGKTAKCVQPKDALEYVAGYTICNDISARSVTFAKDRKNRPWDEFYDWLNGKWADGFLPMGPYLLTQDEIDDVQNLALELKVNGQIRQKANTSQMIYPVADIVSFLSYLMTLGPGDVIATGTPAGVAAATGKFLGSGDQIECKIEKLGILTNTLGQKPKKFYKPLTQD